MRVILVFVGILGLAAADDLSDLKTFLSCFNKAITDGIPSVSIPPHDPLELQDFNIDEGVFKFSLTHIVLHGLLNYTFPVLDVAEKSSDPDTIVYDYAVHWPKLQLTGGYKFYWDLGVLSIVIRESGIYNIVIEDLTWSGIFNMTKPGQEGYNETVNAFTLSSVVKDVQAKITGDEGSYFASTQELLTDLLNDFPAVLADLLRTSLFNEFWLGHPERIQAILNHCGLSN